MKIHFSKSNSRYPGQIQKYKIFLCFGYDNKMKLFLGLNKFKRDVLQGVAGLTQRKEVNICKRL
jgi:hypothetical protein